MAAEIRRHALAVMGANKVMHKEKIPIYVGIAWVQSLPCLNSLNFLVKPSIWVQTPQIMMGNLMSLKNVQETIKQSPMSEGWSESDIKALAEIAEVRILENGDYLAIEGDQDGYLYIIMSGSLTILKKMPGGGQEILCRLERYELAGISAFVDHQKRLADMQAFGKTEVIAISREKFQQLITTQPHVVYKVMCSLVRDSLEIVKRLDDNIVELNDYFKKVNRHY